MFKLLKRWLGWDADAGLLDFGDLETIVRPKTPPTARQAPGRRVTPQGVRPPRGKPAPQRPAPAQAAQREAPKPGQPRAPQTPKPQPKKKSTAEILDNPLLTLDRPKQDGFDPYNTGAFNRSASWERIGRRKR